MEKTTNPYDFLTERQLLRMLRKTSKKLTRYATKGKERGDIEYIRIILLTVSEALQRKREVAWLEQASQLPVETLAQSA